MRKLIFLLILFFCNGIQAADSALGESTWYTRDAAKAPVLQLYFYWSKKCPHCLEALPYIAKLSEQRADIVLRSYQLVGEPENVARYDMMASALGQSASSVPTFFICNTMLTGFDPAITPQQIETLIDRCEQHLSRRDSLRGFVGIKNEPLWLQLPFIGSVEAGANTLPLMTVMIAGVDAFNPCAFFVLMFLLSLLLHTRSRKRMLLVGGVFVFFSGLLYFLFMSAWLNLFRLIGHLDLITSIAAIVAIVIGVINVKDFFWFKRGVSLSIPEQAKPRLFQRMRDLLQARSLLTLLAATIGLALFANMYEFFCTAGFPMVYTRILTLSDLSTTQYYAYLLFYNLIYVVPLAFIVLLFVASMGMRKLQESQGKVLKLLAGMMMLSLGIVLLVAPVLLQNLLVTLLILLATILLSLLIVAIQNQRTKPQSS